MPGVEIGTHHIRLDMAGSTNTFAKHLIDSQRPPEGTVISTGFQFSGRGQGANQWESELGKNLLASFILYPPVTADIVYLLNKCYSVAVLEAMEPLVDNNPCLLSIKWPNDIMAGNRKLAGILVENGIQAGAVNYSVLGIGVNVNQLVFNEYNPPAVSIQMLTGNQHSPDLVLSLICSSLSKWYEVLLNREFKNIDEAYHKRLFRLNTPAFFRINDNLLKAEILFVDDYGNLHLKTGNNEVKTFRNQQVKFVFDT